MDFRPNQLKTSLISISPSSSPRLQSSWVHSGGMLSHDPLSRPLDGIFPPTWSRSFCTLIFPVFPVSSSSKVAKILSVSILSRFSKAFVIKSTCSIPHFVSFSFKSERTLSTSAGSNFPVSDKASRRSVNAIDPVSSGSYRCKTRWSLTISADEIFSMTSRMASLLARCFLCSGLICDGASTLMSFRICIHCELSASLAEGRRVGSSWSKDFTNSLASSETLSQFPPSIST
mmetsp:Transcript_17705/g.33571  ORF Transcript_17705/g.33571 Transcript_17705/m.33571 type:complete len:231 (+) Transcript_17705:243-935(+)